MKVLLIQTVLALLFDHIYLFNYLIYLSIYLHCFLFLLAHDALSPHVIVYFYYCVLQICCQINLDASQPPQRHWHSLAVVTFSLIYTPALALASPFRLICHTTDNIHF